MKFIRAGSSDSPGQTLQVQIISRETIRDKFSIGDIINARVLQKLDKGKFILFLKGLKLVGSSSIDFREGQRIRAMVTGTRDQVQLKILSDPSDVEISPDETAKRLIQMNLKQDPVNEMVLNARMKYRLPITKEAIEKDVRFLLKHFEPGDPTITPTARLQTLNIWSQRIAFSQAFEIPITEKNIPILQNLLPPPDNLDIFIKEINRAFSKNAGSESLPESTGLQRASPGEQPPVIESQNIQKTITDMIQALEPLTAAGIRGSAEELKSVLHEILTPPEHLYQSLTGVLDTILSRVRNDVPNLTRENIQILQDNVTRLIDDLFSAPVSSDVSKVLERFIRSLPERFFKPVDTPGEDIHSLLRKIAWDIQDFKKRKLKIPAAIRDFSDPLAEKKTDSLFTEPHTLKKYFLHIIKNQGFLAAAPKRFSNSTGAYLEIPIGTPGNWQAVGIRIHKKSEGSKKKKQKKEDTRIQIFLQMSRLGNIQVDAHVRKGAPPRVTLDVENTRVENFLRSETGVLEEKWGQKITVKTKRELAGMTWRESIKDSEEKPAPPHQGRLDLLV